MKTPQSKTTSKKIGRILKDSNVVFKYGDMKMRIPRKIKKKLKKGYVRPREVRITCAEVSAGSGRYQGKYSFAVHFEYRKK